MNRMCPSCGSAHQRNTRLCRKCYEATLPVRYCTLPDCDKVRWSASLCAMHGSRLARTGTVERVVLTREEKFWLLADTSAGPGGCWPWQGRISTTGYGRLGHAYAHRFSCELHHGPQPAPHLEVLHECDNRPCVNPAHLSWDTHSKNIADAYRRGRR